MSENEQAPETLEERLYKDAVKLTKASGNASCYEWVRELRIPYRQAVRLMDLMEERGHVQPFLRDDEGNPKNEPGPRKLMTPEFKKFHAHYEAERLQRIQEQRKEAEEERKRQQVIRQPVSTAVEAPQPTGGRKVRRGR